MDNTTTFFTGRVSSARIDPNSGCTNCTCYVGVPYDNMGGAMPPKHLASLRDAVVWAARTVIEPVLVDTKAMVFSNTESKDTQLHNLNLFKNKLDGLTIPGTDVGSVYHVVARTEHGVVAVSDNRVRVQRFPLTDEKWNVRDAMFQMQAQWPDMKAKWGTTQPSHISFTTSGQSSDNNKARMVVGLAILYCMEQQKS